MIQAVIETVGQEGKMNLEYVYNQMVRIIHCDICCIYENGSSGICLGDRPMEMNPLFTDIKFRNQIMSREPKSYPDIFHEHDSIFYAILPIEKGKLVIGPVSIVKPDKKLTSFIMETHQIEKITGFRLAYCEMKIFGSAILMLHHFLTGEELALDELWRQNELEANDINQALASVSSVIFQRQEYELPHNPYDQEVRELDSIRRGDIQMLKQSLEETYRGEVGRLSRNQIRQAKNIAVCVITLASRAAIEGGMIPEEAFSMVDGYILQIEEMNNEAKINAMMRQAEYEFAREHSCNSEITPIE